MGAIGRILVVLALLVLVILGAAWLLNRDDNRTAGEKIGDAINTVPVVVDSAAADFSESSPIAKAGEALENAGEAAESAISKVGAETKEAVSDTSRAAQDRQRDTDRRTQE